MKKNCLAVLTATLGLMCCLVGCGQTQSTDSTTGTNENMQSESVDESTEDAVSYEALSDAVDRGMKDIAERAIRQMDMADSDWQHWSAHDFFSGLTREEIAPIESAILLQDIKTIMLYQTLHGAESFGDSLYNTPYLRDLLTK